MGGSESKKSTDEPGCFSFGTHSGSKLDITLATLGIDNAGKTSIVLTLAKEPIVDLMPTVGFDSKKINYRGHNVTLFDLGGGKKIRGIWRNYLAEVHGIVFVVDASDPDRIEEAAAEFATVCKSPFVSGKPMLILANKSDKANALSEYELTELMGLEEIVNINRIPTKVQASTIQSKDHKTLKDGMDWLYTSITAEWELLTDRVKQDVDAEKQRMANEKKERLERIRRQREAREAEEAKTTEEDGVPEQNPFQPLNKHIANKEKEDREKKAKQAALLADTAALPPITPRSARDSQESKEINEDSPPGFQSVPSKEGADDHTVSHPGASGDGRPPRVPSPLPNGLGHRLPPLGGSSLPPLSSTPLKPLDLAAAEGKKRKKKKKKSRVTPSEPDPEPEDEEVPVKGPGLLAVEEEEAT